MNPIKIAHNITQDVAEVKAKKKKKKKKKGGGD
jgi:hypothetical protein